MQNYSSFTPTASPAPILLVDDETSFCALLAQALTGAGYDVVTAPDGLQAMRIVRSTPLALIIVDRFMPHLDGIQLARQLRSNPYTTDIPLILMSVALPEDRSLFRATLPKPFTVLALLACVEDCYRLPNAPAATPIMPPLT